MQIPRSARAESRVAIYFGTDIHKRLQEAARLGRKTFEPRPAPVKLDALEGVTLRTN